MENIEFQIKYETDLSGGKIGSATCNIDYKSLENYFLDQKEIMKFNIENPNNYPKINIIGAIEKSKFSEYKDGLEKEIKNTFGSELKRAGILIQKYLNVEKR